jgi:REP element-mobilizing transposase RayT
MRAGAPSALVSRVFSACVEGEPPGEPRTGVSCTVALRNPHGHISIIDRIVEPESPMPILSRRHPAHWPAFDVANRSIVVFLTVCVRDRRHLLARPEIRELMIATWRDSADWLVGRFVLMPDHLHLFCAPAGRESAPLANWVRFWKSRSSSIWPFPGEKPAWQADFWDRQLRRTDRYARKWEYVVNNPVRAGLCLRAEDWPYQGELVEFRFHDG